MSFKRKRDLLSLLYVRMHAMEKDKTKTEMLQLQVTYLKLLNSYREMRVAMVRNIARDVEDEIEMKHPSRLERGDWMIREKTVRKVILSHLGMSDAYDPGQMLSVTAQEKKLRDSTMLLNLPSLETFRDA
mgnify:CR=1 FL=1